MKLGIKTKDVYADMLANLDWYDTSEYDPSSTLFSLTNKKRLGKMKDEQPNHYLRSFCGLRAKVYSLEGTDKPIKRAKGICRRVVRDRLQHSDYLATLFGPAEVDIVQRKIVSVNHQVSTVEQKRRGLSGIDDKRYVCRNNIDTFPHGHSLIPIDRLLDEMVGQIASAIWRRRK